MSTGRQRAAAVRRGSFPLTQALSAGLTRERQASFEAGRPLAVGLLLGEITRRGDRNPVLRGRRTGCTDSGIPFFGLGPVGLPIIEAKVIGEISNLYAPFKLATLNPTVRGTLTEDRLPASERRARRGAGAGSPSEATYTFACRQRAGAGPTGWPRVGLDSGIRVLSLVTPRRLFNPLAKSHR